MELTLKQKAKKYTIYCLIILVADLFQNVSGLFPEIYGARCFLILPIVIFFAIGEDIFAGTLIGLFAGFLWDLTSGVHLGFNCIFIALMCFSASAFSSSITRDTFVTNMMSASFTTILYCLICWLFFIIIKGVDGGENTIITFYIPCALYTLVLSPVLWLILNPLKQKLNLIKKQDY